MYKLIVLEGIDKSGKSTIARWLQEHHGFEVIKTNAPKQGEDVFQSYLNTLERVRQMNHDVVIDRFHWGELVYGPIYRGKAAFGEDKLKEIERFINRLGGVIVHCHNDEKKIRDLFIADEEDFTRLEDIKKILESYQHLKGVSICPVYNHQVGENEVTDNRNFLRYLFT